jgi:pyruvate dehydrogenase E2 component (dihydrolipoamide acetyltransferase)
MGASVGHGEATSAVVDEPADARIMPLPTPEHVLPNASRPATPEPRAGRRIYAGPAVRRLARELGVDLGAVRGGGPRSRITVTDVKSHVRTGVAAAIPADILPFPPADDFARFGPIEYESLSRIQQVSARRLLASWRSIPHVTQHTEADISDLENARRTLHQHAPSDRPMPRVTLLPFLFRAVVIALREMPRFNSSLSASGDRLAIKQYFNIGFAADTPRGLVVPVVPDVDKKDVFEIAVELAALGADARSGKLKPDQMQGATFTVSSLGGVGGTHFTPIVNPPEVAILGAGRARPVAVPDGTGFSNRLQLPLSLSYDHRVIDGVAGVRFVERIAALLADPELLMSAVP